jgi:hypothetical protein
MVAVTGLVSEVHKRCPAALVGSTLVATAPGSRVAEKKQFRGGWVNDNA